MSKFCCKHIEHVLENYMVLSYNESLRSFSIDLLNGMHKELWFCPWCGKKFPADLDGVWSKTLNKEFGLKDPLFDDANKVPPEFHTDEWWKKRGL